MENSPKITIEELAVKLNGKMWVKGDLKRIYLDRGYNTKKMSTITYVEETSTGDFNVRCFVECPSQDYNWCKSQAEIVIDGVEEDIEEIVKLSKVQLLEARLSANEAEIEVRISFNGVEETEFLTEGQFDERFNKYPQAVFDSLPETKIIERVVEHIVKNEVPIETPEPTIKYELGSGKKVNHSRFGLGEIIEEFMDGNNKKFKILFETEGENYFLKDLPI